MNVDLLIYPVHLLFWGAFGVTRLLQQRRAGHAPAPQPQPAAQQPRTARWSRSVLALHAVAFGVMYFGIGSAVVPDRLPHWFAGQRVAGTLVIAAGAALMCWALLYFSSWRFRARLDAGHQLATGGPFRLVRHPIYAGMNLLAIGSAIWVPTPILAAGVLLMLVGSDLRGRAEEKLLATEFGAAYTDYCRRTRRFLPGVY